MWFVCQPVVLLAGGGDQLTERLSLQRGTSDQPAINLWLFHQALDVGWVDTASIQNSHLLGGLFANAPGQGSPDETANPIGLLSITDFAGAR